MEIGLLLVRVWHFFPIGNPVRHFQCEIENGALNGWHRSPQKLSSLLVFLSISYDIKNGALHVGWQIEMSPRENNVARGRRGRGRHCFSRGDFSICHPTWRAPFFISYEIDKTSEDNFWGDRYHTACYSGHHFLSRTESVWRGFLPFISKQVEGPFPWIG